MLKVFQKIGLVLALIALAACVPSDVQQACKREAIERGYGKCSVEKGRQNDWGVWIVKMDCSRGVASCQNNTTGNIRVSPWTSMSEHLFEGN